MAKATIFFKCVIILSGTTCHEDPGNTEVQIWKQEGYSEKFAAAEIKLLFGIGILHGNGQERLLTGMRRYLG